MMDSAEAHRFSFEFYPIDVFYIEKDGSKIEDRLIRVALLKDGENTGRGGSTFASGKEYPDSITWSLKEK